MKNIFFKVFSFGILFFGFSAVFAQQGKPLNNYNYNETFANNFYTKNGTDTRSASGQPGAKYWQNRADYSLKATLYNFPSTIS